jgi:hypothetical protein
MNVGNDYERSELAIDPGSPEVCAYCGIANTEDLALSVVDQLVRSHAELRTALRLAGRQILRLQRQDQNLLEKIRETLKRADNIVKTFGVPQDLQEEQKNVEAYATHAPQVVSFFPTVQTKSEKPVSKHAAKRNRLYRPRLLRVVK